jgi:GDP-L-fucose synthase
MAFTEYNMVKIKNKLITSSSYFHKGKMVLVTGGSGFIGSQLVEKLVREKGLNIRIVSKDRPSTFIQHLIKSYSPSVEFIKGDLTDLQTCVHATKDIDYVFHTAGLVRNSIYNMSQPGTMLSTNLLINTNMLEAARRSSVERYQFVSSTAGYPARAAIPYKEESFFDGDIEPSKSPYGWSKRIGEMQAFAYHKEFGMKISIVRPSNTYGPFDNFEPDRSNAITFFIKNAVHKTNPFIIWGDGTEKRAYIYITDLISGMLSAMEKMDTPDPINLGTDEEVSVDELSTLVLRLSDFENAKIVYDKSKPKGQARISASTEKAMNLIGFVPQIKLEEGLKNTIDWYRMQMLRSCKIYNY